MRIDILVFLNFITLYIYYTLVLAYFINELFGIEMAKKLIYLHLFLSIFGIFLYLYLFLTIFEITIRFIRNQHL